MDLIPSFAVDHTNLPAGIYISREDLVGSEPVTTYDIRMTSPNREPAIAPAAIHTIEHIVATYLRNHPEWKDSIVYWGPMGCLTGNYLILKGKPSPEELRPLMIDAFQYVVDYEGQVPGATNANCGNYLMHDLPMAKWEAKRYIERLKNDFHTEYNKAARAKSIDGKEVFDA